MGLGSVAGIAVLRARLELPTETTDLGAHAVGSMLNALDGDVVFFLASCRGPAMVPGVAASWTRTVIGASAATVTVAAIRDGVR